MHLTWKQRKALKLAELILKRSLLQLKPFWEAIPHAIAIELEIRTVSAESQYYDAAAKLHKTPERARI